MTNTSAIIRSKTVADQALDILRQRIEKGEYSPDKRMPSEEHLAQELRVSRASIRTALASLAAAGYIQRRHGDGTYPRARTFQIGLLAGKGWEIENQIRASGKTPGLLIVEHVTRPATPEEHEQLDLPEAEPVLAVQRVFYADAQPAAYIISIIRSQGLAPEIPDDADTLPPLDFLYQYHAMKPGSGRVQFNAVLASQPTAALMSVEPGTPLLLMSSTLYDSLNHPVLFEKEFYPGSIGFQLPSGFIQS